MGLIDGLSISLSLESTLSTNHLSIQVHPLLVLGLS